MWLKQSTSTTFLVGPVLDASGLPVTTAGTSDFRISKAGTTAIFSGGTATHDTNGNYKITLTTGNTDTIGSLEIGMHNTSYAMSVHRFMVIEPTIFDDLVSTATNASGGLRDVARINGQTVNAAASVTFPASVADETTVASKASQTSVDTLASYVDTEVTAIKAKTDNLPAQPAAVSDIPTANQNRDAVWNIDAATVFPDGSLGDRILISQNNTRALAVTGSGHIAAVLHDAEPNSIPEDAFVSGAISARVIAADAATEIATEVGNLQVLSRLDSMIESDGNGQFRFDTIALSMAAGGAGSTDWTANERTAIRSILGIPASGTTPADPSVGILDTIRDGVNSIGINVYPVTSSTPERVNGTTITVYKDEQTNVTISTTATLTGLTLRFVAEDRTGADVLVVENASFVARTATSVTLQIPSSVTDEIASYTWTLRDVTTGNSVLARGVLSVQAAASKNA